MQYVRLGRTGLQISRICLGMMTYGNPKWRAWVLDETASRPVVKRAIDLGVNFFDTADMYSAGESEVLTGKFLKAYCKPEEAVVASKVFYPVDMDFSGAQSVRRTAHKIATKSNTMADLVKKGKVKVLAGRYHLDEGRVEFFA